MRKHALHIVDSHAFLCLAYPSSCWVMHSTNFFTCMHVLEVSGKNISYGLCYPNHFSAINHIFWEYLLP